MVSWSPDERRAARRASKREAAARYNIHFLRQAWPIIEPGTPLEENWHLELVCDALDRQIAGDPVYRKLLICMPPGTMKSILVSVIAPARRWLWEPEYRGLFLANDDDLVIRDSRRTRDLIMSEWYQELLEHMEAEHGIPAWTLARDQNQKANFENTRRGFRQCRSIGSKITGKRGKGLALDDLLDAKEVVNGTVEQVNQRVAEVNRTVEKVLPSRVNRLAEAPWTLIMQRLHVDDPAARAMQEGISGGTVGTPHVPGGWYVINLQMEFEPENPLNHPADPRKEKGELLFPGLFPEDELAKLRKKLGLQHYSAQYQQRPTLLVGGRIQRAWFEATNGQPARNGRYTIAPHRIAPTMDEIFGTVDAAVKAKASNDWHVIQVWGRKGRHYYLLDSWRERVEYPAFEDAFDMMVKRWPTAKAWLVEDKANGATLLQRRRATVRMLDFDPSRDTPGDDASKAARAKYVEIAAEAGAFLLPLDEHAPWLREWIEEIVGYLAGAAHDDQMDATSQLVMRWELEGNKPDPLKAVKNQIGLWSGLGG